MEVCLKEELLVIIEFEEVFRNGVFLVKLGNFFFLEVVLLCKIFDKDLKVVNVSKFNFVKFVVFVFICCFM